MLHAYSLVPRCSLISFRNALPSESTLALADSTTRDDFFRNLSAAQLESRHGIVSSQADANSSTWRLWTCFCLDLVVDPTLQSNVANPIHLLLVFAHQYRTRIIAPCGRPV
jgi:hypothetical protein